MSEPPDDRDFQALLRRLDVLLQGVERVEDPVVRTRTREIVQAILELHGVGLGRLLDHIHEAGDAGSEILNACARDEVAGGLLLLHEMHPIDLEGRVQLALEKVRPRLGSHGGDVELLDIADGVARVRLLGSCDGCPSSALTMKQTIEESILGHAPDLDAVVVDGVTAETGKTPEGLTLVTLGGL